MKREFDTNFFGRHVEKPNALGTETDIAKETVDVLNGHTTLHTVLCIPESECFDPVLELNENNATQTITPANTLAGSWNDWSVILEDNDEPGNVYSWDNLTKGQIEKLVKEKLKNVGNVNHRPLDERFLKAC